jgi:heterodisulfide reductase subunit C
MKLDVTHFAQSATPGVLPGSEAELRASFLAQVDRIPGGELLRRCLQCGTCSGSCPVAYAMDVSPRQMIAFFRAGAIEPLLRSRTIWLCASCYQCTARCPAEIKITDLLYALKRLALEKRILPDRFPVYALSQLFAATVRRHGRNFEAGLLARFFLRTGTRRPFANLADAFALWRHGRLALRPRNIRDRAGLRRLIARADLLARPQEAIERQTLVDRVGYRAMRTRPSAAATAI